MTPPATSPSQKNLTPTRHDAEDLAASFSALMVEAERVAHSVAAGAHGRRQAGAGETFWQHRPYAFGDPVNAIDWRQSARASGRLYIRQNEWEAAATIWIWRDASPSLEYSSQKNVVTKRWRANVMAVAIAILLSQAGERVGLIGQTERPFQGRSAPARFLEALLTEQDIKTKTAPEKIQMSPGAKVLLISDFFNNRKEIEDAAAYFASIGADGALVQIVDAAEEDFPFKGRTEFRDVVSKDRLTFGNAASIAGKYQHAFAAHRDDLNQFSRRLGWPLITHRTDRPAQSALLALYAALSDGRALHQSGGV